MDSFRIQFSKDNKVYTISVAKLRADLLNAYISENLKLFDIVKQAKDKSETKVKGEKTKASLKNANEALRKSEESKNAALRLASQASAERDAALEELAKLKAKSK